jgi:acetyl-CoA carboxylase biotin carboxyl carrier protein
MTSPLDQIPHLAALLAATGIDTLELAGPAGRVFLGRSGAPAATVPALDAAAPGPEAGAAATVTVASPGIGAFRRAHPLHEQPLAEEGSEVAAGQVLALLQVGDLLLPVRAPSGGILAAARRADGALTGFGDPLFDILPPR